MLQLETMILNGLTSRLQLGFNLKELPTFISSSDRWHLADRIQAQQQGNAKSNQGTIQLPQTYLRLVTLSINNESYNNNALMLNGKYGAKKEGSNTVNRYELMAATYAFEFVHISQNFMDMFQFARDYVVRSLRRQSMNFTINYDGLALDVRVFMDDNVSPPEKDASVDTVNIYELTSNIRVNGWVMDERDTINPVPLVQRVQHELIPTLTPPAS